MSGYRVDLGVLKEEFALRLADFCDAYLPGGVRVGHEYIVGGVHGEAGRSMAVHLSGSRAGTWADFGNAPADHRGDSIDLVRFVLFGGDKKAAIRWMIGECGLADVGHEQMTVRRARAQAKAVARREADEKDAAEKRGRAFHIWAREAQADIAGSPVEAYLNGRGIALDMLNSYGALRYHPRLFNTESERHYPAMVAAVVNGEGKFIAAHRTWLELRPDGRVTKAQLETPKKVLGLFKGGYISLQKGASGVSLNNAPAGDHALMVEGIEDGLTYAMAAPELRVIAAISLDNMANAPLPSHLGRLTIGGDNDEGAQEQAKLMKAVNAQIRRGIADVRLALTPQHKDINALHQAANELAGVA